MKKTGGNGDVEICALQFCGVVKMPTQTHKLVDMGLKDIERAILERKWMHVIGTSFGTFSLTLRKDALDVIVSLFCGHFYTSKSNDFTNTNMQFQLSKDIVKYVGSMCGFLHVYACATK